MTKALVLLSGGMDSAVCLFVAVELYGSGEVEALFFDWGQRAVVEERAACRALCDVARVKPPVEIALDFPYGGPLTDENAALPSMRTAGQIAGGGVAPTFFPGRNVVMLAYAFGLAAQRGASQVYFGANAQDATGYPDCRAEFLEEMEQACRIGVDSNLRLVAPLAGMSDDEIVRRGQELAVPWGLTFSCYAPTEGTQCGTCDSCILRKRALDRLS